MVERVLNARRYVLCYSVKNCLFMHHNSANICSCWRFSMKSCRWYTSSHPSNILPTWNMFCVQPTIQDKTYLILALPVIHIRLLFLFVTFWIDIVFSIGFGTINFLHTRMLKTVVACCSLVFLNEYNNWYAIYIYIIEVLFLLIKCIILC